MQLPNEPTRPQSPVPEDLQGVLPALPRHSIELADIVTVWRAHSEASRPDAVPYRKFDPSVPYAAHPVWCALSLWCEPGVPQSLRHAGAQALLYHDVPEDTLAALPPWLAPHVRQYVADMTYPGGGLEERRELWNKPPEIRLFKLYDKTSNLLEGVWMNDEQRLRHTHFLSLLADDVRKRFPELNILRMADALIDGLRMRRSVQSGEQGAAAERLRISVGNLVPRLRCGDEQLTFGILNRKQFERGVRLFGALGGAAELTPNGARSMQRVFDAELSEGRDARFSIRADDAEAVLKVFAERNAGLHEVDPVRELREELTQRELPGIPPVFRNEDLANLKLTYLSSYRQPSPSNGGMGTSARAGNEMATRRLFNLFELEISPWQLATLRAHPAIQIFSNEELASTEGGRCKGLTADGAVLADNLFVIQDSTHTGKE